MNLYCTQNVTSELDGDSKYVNEHFQPFNGSVLFVQIALQGA